MILQIGGKQMFKIFDTTIIIIQILLSLFLLYLVRELLPLNFIIAIGCVLAVIIGIELIFLIKKRKIKVKNGKRVRSRKMRTRLVCMVVAICIAVVDIYAVKGFKTLGNITTGKYQTTVVSLVVKNDSEYKKVADLQDLFVGYTNSMDEDVVDEVMADIKNKQKTTLQYSDYRFLNDLVIGFNDGEEQAMIFNEGLRASIEEIDPDFSKNTRVIYQYESKKEVSNDFSKSLENLGDCFTVYISGIDTYGPVNSVSRSDVNMLVTVNIKEKKILMVSIPRDYYVELASFGAYDKLTHAGVYGVEESMDTLSLLLDEEIPYYARVNFTSLITMVDAIDGITVYNDQEFVSYHNGKYHPVGNLTFNGEEALEFVRERYGLENGDNDRVKNQQKVLRAMLDKMMSPKIITNYSKILKAVEGSFQTNISSQDIQSLVQMQLSDMAKWTFESISLTGYETMTDECYSMWGTDLYVIEQDEDSVLAAKAAIDAMYTKSES